MFTVDYFNVAKDMLILLEEYNQHYCILHDKEDVMEVALFLEKAIDPEIIAELAVDNEGMMLLIGIVTATYGFTKGSSIQPIDENPGESVEKDEKEIEKKPVYKH